MKVEQIHIFISGVVQGVGFRHATRKMADALELTGWVKNLEDGRVEVWAEGAPDNLDHFVQWCSRGPNGASVSQVKVEARSERVTAPSETFKILK